MKFIFVLCVAVLLAHIPHAAVGQTPTPETDSGKARKDTTGAMVPFGGMDKVQLKSDLAQLASSEQPGVRQWDVRKSPTVATISNMLLPGLGQVYNGRRWKAVIVVGLSTWFVVNIAYNSKQEVRWEQKRDTFEEGSLEWKEADLWRDFYKETARDFMWWMGATWLLSTLDAFIDAHLYDVRSVDPAVIKGANENRYYGLSVKF